MNQSRYNTQSWYAPLVTDEDTRPLPMAEIEGWPESNEKKSRKKRSNGLTPGRIVGLIVILMAVIVGSSLAFRQIDDGENSTSIFTSPSDEEEMPDAPPPARRAPARTSQRTEDKALLNVFFMIYIPYVN